MARNTATYWIGTIAFLVVAAGFLSALPDLKRYIRITRM